MALRPLSYFWTQFLRTWKADIGTTFLAPVLYLASLGLGLGALVGHGHALASLGGKATCRSWPPPCWPPPPCRWP